MNLESLDLGNNQLSTIESGTFSGLANLTLLKLDQNQISNIESGDFSELTNLESLDLYRNQIPSIEPGDFNGLGNLDLDRNQLTSIEPGDFSGLPHLTYLELDDNQLSSIESGAFSGLTNLTYLFLQGNMVLTELNLQATDFSSLTRFTVRHDENITSVSLRNTVVNQTSLSALLDGGRNEWGQIASENGIGGLNGIAEMDLSGIDFVNISDLSVFYSCPSDRCESRYGMNDLTDLWLVKPANTTQAGPARIVTLSADPSRRNFTLGQAADDFEVRFRTNTTSANGEPSLWSSSQHTDTGPDICALRSAAGDLAVLYFAHSGQVTLNGTRRIGGMRAEWFNPREGSSQSAEPITPNTYHAPDDEDWVLLLRKP